MAINIEKVRVLIVGDSGVGKTCLTHLIAHNESLADPGWTVGCNIEIKLHNYKEQIQQRTVYAIELFDIGGSLNHKNTRSVFYNTIHGIMLVHDLTNRKSHDNLREWLYGIIMKEGKDTHKHGRADSSQLSQLLNSYRSDTSTADNSGFDQEELFGAIQVPVLVVGTKLDLLEEKNQSTAVPKTGGIADQCGAEEVWLNCHNAHSLSAGSMDTVKLTRFFDRVIEKQAQARECNYFSGNVGSTERRRYYTPTPNASASCSPISSLLTNGTDTLLFYVE